MKRIKISNLSKPTPVEYSRIGNVIILLVLGLQPLIIEASTDVMSVKAKFWVSVSLSIFAVVGKTFASMIDSKTPLN